MVTFDQVYLGLWGGLTDIPYDGVTRLDTSYGIPLSWVFWVATEFWKIEQIPVNTHHIWVDGFDGLEKDSKIERVAFLVM